MDKPVKRPHQQETTKGTRPPATWRWPIPVRWSRGGKRLEVGLHGPTGIIPWGYPLKTGLEVMGMSQRSEEGFRSALRGILEDFRIDVEELLGQFISEPKTRGKPLEYPLTDLIEYDDHYVVEAELPGVKRSNIEVEVASDAVRIKGSINLDRKATHKGGRYLLMERRDQDFNKEIRLPVLVNPKDAEARLVGGVLTIRLPKKPPETLEWTRLEIEEG